MHRIPVASILDTPLINRPGTSSFGTGRFAHTFSSEEVPMRKLWRGIVNFFVEALQDNTKPLAQRKREAAAREHRWNRYLKDAR